jgi:hypothetical protein
MRSSIRFFIASLFLVCSIGSYAQSNSDGTWFVYFGNQKINKSWNVQSDFQYRLKQVPEQASQLIMRAGLGYNLTPGNHNVLLGAAYVQTKFSDELNDKPDLEEKRIYQQYLFKQNFKNLYTTHRVRLEERFLPNEFGLRSRYFLSVQKPFNGKGLNKNSVYGSFFNELFVDIKNSKFDRNRFYAGLGYAINSDIRIETGYLIQSQKNSTRGQLQFVLYNNLSF